MIGVFDSGLWGVQTLNYMREYLPGHDFVYLWDTLYVPYGARDAYWIQQRTFQCLDWMFDQWCELVILACNTASAVAVRPRQEAYPDRKVLSVTVPGVEALVEWWFGRPLLLWTQRTVDSEIYQRVLERSFGEYEVDRVSYVGTGWVDCLEWWWESAVIADHQQSDLVDLSSDRDCVILWCTHYPLLAGELTGWVSWLPLINPGELAAQRLSTYLDHHPEIAERLGHGGDVRLYVSWDVIDFERHIHRLWGEVGDVVGCEI